MCKAFRAKGHEAYYSADIQEPSGGPPEWHILGDVLPIINGDCKFTTMDGAEHEVVGEWERIWQLGSGHAKERSKTFPGIAKAMAEQWGD